METKRLFLTDDDIAEVRHMFDWRFWYDAVFWSTLAAGFAVALAITRDLIVLFLLIIFGALALLNLLPRIREYNRFKTEIEMRLAEVVLTAPQRVWRPKNFFCYIRINGTKIRVPWDRYHELKDANLVRVWLLPQSRVAVRVEISQLGTGV